MCTKTDQLIDRAYLERRFAALNAMQNTNSVMFTNQTEGCFICAMRLLHESDKLIADLDTAWPSSGDNYMPLALMHRVQMAKVGGSLTKEKS